MRITAVVYRKVRGWHNQFIAYLASIQDEISHIDPMDAYDEEDGARSEEFSAPFWARSFLRYAHPQGLLNGYGAQLLVGNDAIESAPRLILSDALFRELHYYFSASDMEFQLMGLVRQECGNRFVVSEWLHNPHSAGVSHADMDQDAFPAWLDALERQGKDIRLLRAQVHSHGVLEAYFSSTDVATIRDAYSCSWMISIVGNRAGAIFARLDVYEPVPLSMSIPIIVEFLQVISSEEEKRIWQKKRDIGTQESMAEKGDEQHGRPVAAA